MRPYRFSMLKTLILVFVTACTASCVGTKREVLIIEQGQPVQLADPVKVRVFVTRDGQRIKSNTKATIPAGWWAISDPGE